MAYKIGGMKFKPAKGLGAGLGLGPQNRKNLLGAVKTGMLDDYLKDKPALRTLFEEKLTSTPTGTKGNRQKTRAQLLAFKGGLTPGGPAALPVVDPTLVPGTTTPEAAPPPPVLTPQQMIEQAGGTTGQSAQALNDYLQNRLNTLGGGLPQPTFEEMFNRWMTVSQKEADRQSASITEEMGSRGARWGSDLMNRQRDYRAEFMDRIMSKADEVNRGLRQDRTAEEQMLLSPRLSTAALEEQARQAAWQRLLADSLATRGLPPAVLEAIRATAGLTPDTIVSGG